MSDPFLALQLSVLFIEKNESVFSIMLTCKRVRLWIINNCSYCFGSRSFKFRMKKIPFLQKKELVVEYVQVLDFDIRPHRTNRHAWEDMTPQQRRHLDSYFSSWSPLVHFPNVKSIIVSHDYRYLRKHFFRKMVFDKASTLTTLYAFGVEVVIRDPLPCLTSLSLIECTLKYSQSSVDTKMSEIFPKLDSFVLSFWCLMPVKDFSEIYNFDLGYTREDNSISEIFQRPACSYYKMLKFLEQTIPFSQLKVLELRHYGTITMAWLQDKKRGLFKSLEFLSIGSIFDLDEFFGKFEFPSLKKCQLFDPPVAVKGRGWNRMEQLESIEIIGSVPLGDDINESEPGFGKEFFVYNQNTFPKLKNIVWRGSYWEYLFEKFGFVLGVPSSRGINGSTLQQFCTNRIFIDFSTESEFTCLEVLTGRVSNVSDSWKRETLLPEHSTDTPGILSLPHMYVCFPDFTLNGDCVGTTALYLAKIPFSYITKLKYLQLENLILHTNLKWKKPGGFEDGIFDFIHNNEEFRILEKLVLKNVYFSVDLRCNQGEEPHKSREFLLDKELNFGGSWGEMNSLKELEIKYDRIELLQIPVRHDDEEAEEFARSETEPIFRPHLAKEFLSLREFPSLEKLVLWGWPMTKGPQYPGHAYHYNDLETKVKGLFDGIPPKVKPEFQNCDNTIVNEWVRHEKKNQPPPTVGLQNEGEGDKTRFRLDQMSVKNFKLFQRKRTFNFSKFCVFVGENGNGKSTVLLAILNVLRCHKFEFIDLRNFIQKTSKRVFDDTRFGWKKHSWWQYFNEERLDKKEYEFQLRTAKFDCIFNYKFSQWSLGDGTKTFTLKTHVEEVNRNRVSKKNSFEFLEVSENCKSIEEVKCLGNVLYINSAYIREFLKNEGIDLSSGEVGELDNFIHSMYSEITKMNEYLDHVKRYFRRHFSFAEIDENPKFSLLVFRKSGKRTPFSKLSQGEKMIVLYILLVCWLATKDCPTKVVLFDEIESNLHPRLLRQFHSFLDEFSRDFQCQIICSSHSEIFVGCFDYRDVYHLEKDQEAKSIRMESFAGLSRVLFKLGYSHEKKIENLYQFSKILHCRRLILVEGTSDVAFLDRWLEFFGNYISPVYRILRSFVQGTINCEGDIKFPKHAFNVISDWRTVLKSLVAIQNIEPDGKKKRNKKKAPCGGKKKKKKGKGKMETVKAEGHGKSEKSQKSVFKKDKRLGEEKIPKEKFQQPKTGVVKSKNMEEKIEQEVLRGKGKKTRRKKKKKGEKKETQKQEEEKSESMKLKEMREGMKFFLFCDEDVHLKEKVEHLRSMFESYKSEGILYHRLRMREIENYILALCYKLLKFFDEDKDAMMEKTDLVKKWVKKWVKKYKRLKGAIIEKHNVHHAKPKCFDGMPKKEETPREPMERKPSTEPKIKNKDGSKKRESRSAFRNEKQLNDGKPVYLDNMSEEKLEKWFEEKGILSKVIAEDENEVPVSTLEFIEAKSILKNIFHQSKYMAECWTLISNCPLFQKKPQDFINRDITLLLGSLKDFYFDEVSFICSECNDNEKTPKPIRHVVFAHGYLLPTFELIDEVKFFVEKVDARFEFKPGKVIVKSSKWENSLEEKRVTLDKEKKNMPTTEEKKILFDDSVTYNQNDVLSFLRYFNEFREKDGKLFSIPKSQFEKIFNGKVPWLTIKLTKEIKPLVKRDELFKSRGKGTDGIFVSFPTQELTFQINRVMKDDGKVMIISFHCGSFRSLKDGVRFLEKKKEKTVGGKRRLLPFVFQVDLIEHVCSESELLFTSQNINEDRIKRIKFNINIVSTPGFKFEGIDWTGKKPKTGDKVEKPPKRTMIETEKEVQVHVKTNFEIRAFFKNS